MLPFPLLVCPRAYVRNSFLGRMGLSSWPECPHGPVPCQEAGGRGQSWWRFAGSAARPAVLELPGAPSAVAGCPTLGSFCFVSQGLLRSSVLRSVFASGRTSLFNPLCSLSGEEVALYCAKYLPEIIKDQKAYKEGKLQKVSVSLCPEHRRREGPGLGTELLRRALSLRGLSVWLLLRLPSSFLGADWC